MKQWFESGKAAWSDLSEPQRRFVLITLAAAAVGPVLASQDADVAPLLIAAAGLTMLVCLRWIGEASGVRSNWATLAAFAAAALLSLSLAGVGAAVLWVVVLALTAVALRPDVIASERTASSPSVEEPPDEDDAAFSQIRRRFEDVEVIEGITTVADGSNHVVFHPPMDGMPEVELHPMDDLRVTLNEVTPHGFRVAVKGEGRVAYAASSSHSSQGSTISSLAG